METDAQPAAGSAAPRLVIEPSKGWVRLGAQELWRYRELLYFLTWKNILIQYKQAVLGVAWAVLNPILTMIVFTVIFNKFLHIGTGSNGGCLPRVRLRGAAAVEPVLRLAVERGHEPRGQRQPHHQGLLSAPRHSR